MPTLSAFFDTLDTSSALGMALCWEINRTDGVSLYFTNHDEALTAEYESVSKTFLPTTNFSGSAMVTREGASVDNLNVTALTSNDITERDLLAGKYDDAEIIIYLVQWDNLANGLHILKRGFLGEVTSVGSQFETEVRGLPYKLQQKTGRTYTLECNADLGDARCGVAVGDYYTVPATVATVTDARSFTINLTGEATTYFQYGKATFLTGDNTGVTIEVLGHTVDGGTETIILLEKAAYAVDVGDILLLVAGCDKSVTTCKAKFNNFLNYRGFPDMPTETEALQTPDAK